MQGIYIKKISNGYLCTTYYEQSKTIETFHPTMEAVVLHLNNTEVSVEKVAKELKEKREQTISSAS